MRPTYTAILGEAMLAVQEDGFDRFSVQRVLDRADISRATLYRYFPDVDGLIEAALIETFRQEIDRNLNVVMALVESAPDGAAFRASIRQVVEGISTVSAGVRLLRAHTIALASTRPRLAVAVSEAQDALTDGWEAAIAGAKQRGFLRDGIDPRAVAVLIQAVTIGRIIDDAASTRLGNERWAQSFFDLIDAAFLAPDD